MEYSENKDRKNNVAKTSKILSIEGEDLCKVCTISLKKNRGMVLMYGIDENCQCYSI